jgi:hypothetical protein
VTVKLPRHMIYKTLASGIFSYYYNIPSLYRAMKCPVPNEPLGTDYAEASKRAATLNSLFDEWSASRKGLPVTGAATPFIGTVDWLFREYKQSKAFTEKVATRSRKNYEWAMAEIGNVLTKSGHRIGSRPIKSITPRGADKIYDRLTTGTKGQRLRTAEKIVMSKSDRWQLAREHLSAPRRAQWPSMCPERRGGVQKRSTWLCNGLPP